MSSFCSARGSFTNLFRNNEGVTFKISMGGSRGCPLSAWAPPFTSAAFFHQVRIAGALVAKAYNMIYYAFISRSSGTISSQSHNFKLEFS